MTAFNVVRFQTKVGFEEEFEEQYRKLSREFEGLRRIVLIKTGPQAYCGIGEWDGLEHMIAARPLMIGNLDNFRHTLQELGGDIGVTDAISGEAIYEKAPAKRER
ncbi:DUF718 domain-containing protein [Rhizobium jaguaris]|uniref:DUF718 domain-containing protein n=1 Tax=Rhizobium jaguaris TaxID=1312183 RepID=A0A387FZ11_9HYPH|nr:DUF718 domain-containing protein [Rhizobium jaguaris]AYG60892.1 DUF718 domain-containing protein [Rhizobium jaguaris]